MKREVRGELFFNFKSKTANPASVHKKVGPISAFLQDFLHFPVKYIRDSLAGVFKVFFAE